jgi:hypothetical protein
MAAGAQRTSTLRTPSSAPLPPPNYGRGRRLALPTLSGGGALIAIPVGTAPAPHTIPVGMMRVHPPAATLNVRDPFRVAGEGPGATTHPRSPAPINVNWVLRDSSPGVRLRLWAPFSSSSAFFSLPPFVCLPGELRALALLGAPLLPLPSGAPLPPRHPGAMGGRRFPPSLFGRGVDGLSYPSPLQGKLPSDQGRSRAATSLIREATTRRCRAGFRRRPHRLP